METLATTGHSGFLYSQKGAPRYCSRLSLRKWEEPGLRSYKPAESLHSLLPSQHILKWSPCHYNSKSSTNVAPNELSSDGDEHGLQGLRVLRSTLVSLFFTQMYIWHQDSGKNLPFFLCFYFCHHLWPLAMLPLPHVTPVDWPIESKETSLIWRSWTYSRPTHNVLFLASKEIHSQVLEIWTGASLGALFYILHIIAAVLNYNFLVYTSTFNIYFYYCIIKFCCLCNLTKLVNYVFKFLTDYPEISENKIFSHR